ncbi:hypothetical protein BFW01_g7270 [Lasiodiplodia theobromae]|uniref:uncharacterized protein n=1 Tax=Lasiodiplodia theobromae TaxID=45133 RepID=UPI0015C3B6DD|nr:uncharacterized protein LTHEOB_6953 [Lasiodiplodia theobromae]KAF4543219.1 hypothetical protein LTHEOB_6953 [Lasiodiplodia theobromae]KAF9636374.1 hypothetical protein BFW01_g7270 [Lasiodiplodia theobromae]
MADDNQARSQEQQLPPDQQGSGAKVPAPKDKNCPFCHQAFTSSSLGRHLDLYIKPKNPKAPDGIHNVDEIRRMRGGITRRQARNSLAKKGDSSGGSTPVSSQQQQPPPPPPTAPQQVPVASQQQQQQQAPQQGHQHNPSVSAVSADTASPVITQSPTLNMPASGQKLRFQFNQPSWTSTGVINNLPPRASVSSETGKTRHELQKRGLENRQIISDELDHGKAAELALKEVLASVRDASARSAGVNLFDFDPYTLSFPSLCLHILPAPATLFSPSPFPNSESWSISPPGQKQFDALNKNIRDRLVQRQRHSQLFGATNPLATTPSASAASPLPTPPLGGFDPDPQRLFQHLQEAYNHWKSLSDKQRQETWTLEILRSYTRADESRREAENSLASARKEIEALKNNRWINMGMASSTTSAYGAGAAQSPGSSLALSSDTFKELAGKQSQGLDPRTWDYEKLMEKWTTVVKENKKTMLGLANQRSLSTGSVPASTPMETRTTRMPMPMRRRSFRRKTLHSNSSRLAFSNNSRAMPSASNTDTTRSSRNTTRHNTLSNTHHIHNIHNTRSIPRPFTKPFLRNSSLSNNYRNSRSERLPFLVNHRNTNTLNRLPRILSNLPHHSMRRLGQAWVLPLIHPRISLDCRA